MTAEAVVCNRVAIALAADSALTVSSIIDHEDGHEEISRKVYSDADKIFELVRGRPVGVMLYDAADLLSAPWEIIIKWYRKSRAGVAFGSLIEYAEDFESFIMERQDELFSHQTVANFCHHLVGKLTDDLLSSVLEQIDERDRSNLGLLSSTLTSILDQFEREPRADSLPWAGDLEPEDLLDEYDEAFLLEAVSRHLLDFEIDDTSRARLRDWALARILCDKNIEPRSGIVLAGFGEAEAFPSLLELSIAGFLCGRVMLLAVDVYETSAEDQSFIKTFAQVEDANAFISGISVEVKEAIEEYWRTWLRELPRSVVRIAEGEIDDLPAEQRRKFLRQVRNYSNRAWNQFASTMNELHKTRLVEPLEMSAAYLSKAGLAGLAENLVNISAIRSKIALDREETVGGETDVAVISKGDGFIWVKRKHYFSPHLNPLWASRQSSGAVYLPRGEQNVGEEHDV